MNTLFSRFSSPYYIDLPYHIIGWLGLVFLCGLLGVMLWRYREPVQFHRWPRWLILFGLIAAIPVAESFFGLQVPGETALPLPMLPVERGIPAIMFFAALPWVFASGMLGTIPAVILGGLSGLFIALTESHSLYTPLQIAGLALIFSGLVRQRYRTLFYRLLRHPIVAAIFTGVVFFPIFMLTGFFEVNGPVAVRLDYGLTQTWPILFARSAELLIASVFAEVIFAFKVPIWLRPAILKPSPSETSLQTRFFYTTLPLVMVLVFTLFVADWRVAGNAARQMVKDRLASTAQVAADSLPYFMEAGQNLMLNMATADLFDLPVSNVSKALSDRLRSIPYFRQLYLLDGNGNPIGGYPANQFIQIQPTREELAGIKLALKGILIQSYVIPPFKNETTAQVSFLALIRDGKGQPIGVLLGRTDLNSNPFTQPVIQALEAVRRMGGEGMILDEANRMLYSPTPALVMKYYFGRVPQNSEFFDENSQQGTRQLVYVQPVPGRPWSIVLTVPAQQAQQLGLQIAVPLFLILLVASAVVFVFLRLALKGVTGNLQDLGQEASRISQGELNHPLNIHGEDEVGRLGGAFEKMRLSLKARLDELNRLLLVSQGIASTLDVKDAIRPVLDAAVCDGACMARVVLTRNDTLDSQGEKPIAYGLGMSSDAYAYLDEQLFEIMRGTEYLTISNTARMRRLVFPSGKPHPTAVMARALYHESSYYGVLWIAYPHPHVFSEEEVCFFATLAGQAALAAANARLYTTAEVGRQRLEAVLASTPEPVLVTDAQGRLLLLNPAALQVPGLVMSSTAGRAIREVIPIPALLDLLTGPYENRQLSQEISLTNNKIYYASVSPVMADGQPVGKVCILRDITHYKELDVLKSDFVATVSHDLRSPLTLMRGYATMLQMVGDLNEQQKGYLRKINLGVENMTRLVNNLLDLGRIEAGIDLQLEKVLAGDVIDQVVTTLQPQAAQKNIGLSLEMTSQHPVMIEGDGALLQQAFYNLVENAIKYTPVAGQVRVRLVARPNGMGLEVHDTGIGIAPLDLPRLFEKFFRSGRREAYQQRGTGLGLAIVKSIAERHGGKVWVESTLGKGSSFYLEIPYQHLPLAQLAD